MGGDLEGLSAVILEEGVSQQHDPSHGLWGACGKCKLPNGADEILEDGNGVAWNGRQYDVHTASLDRAFGSEFPPVARNSHRCVLGRF